MSAQTQQKQSNQSPSAQSQGSSSSTASGATDMASFGSENAVEYQNTLGNQGVQSASGQEGGEQEASGASGFALLEELDGGVASRLENVEAMADTALSDYASLLSGTPAAADVADLETVQAHIDGELAGLKATVELGDDLAVDEALGRIATYTQNLTDCSLIVDAEGCVVLLFEDCNVAALAAAFGILGTEVTALEEPANAAKTTSDEITAQLGELKGALADLADIALSAQLDAWCDTLTEGLLPISGAFGKFKRVAASGIKLTATFTKDWAHGLLAGDDLQVAKTDLDVAQDSVDMLNDSVGLVPPKGSTFELASNVYKELKRIKDVDAASLMLSIP